LKGMNGQFILAIDVLPNCSIGAAYLR